MIRSNDFLIKKKKKQINEYISYLIRENLKSLHRSRLVQRLVLVRAKYFREILGQQSSESEVRVGDSQRTVLLVTSWARMCPGALGPDLEQARPEEKHRSASCRNCVHVQLQSTEFLFQSFSYNILLYRANTDNFSHNNRFSHKDTNIEIYSNIKY